MKVSKISIALSLMLVASAIYAMETDKNPSATTENVIQQLGLNDIADDAVMLMISNNINSARDLILICGIDHSFRELLTVPSGLYDPNNPTIRHPQIPIRLEDLSGIKNIDDLLGMLRSYRNCAWISLNLFSFANTLDNRSLEIILKECPFLTSLNLKACYYITDAGLQYLPQTLTSLNLSCCHKITDAGLVRLQNLPLTSLNLSFCNKITDAGLQYLPQTLTSLNLKACYYITDAGLQYLPQTLTSLDLRFGYSCKITDAGLNKMLNHLPKLREIRIPPLCSKEKLVIARPLLRIVDY